MPEPSTSHIGQEVALAALAALAAVLVYILSRISQIAQMTSHLFRNNISFMLIRLRLVLRTQPAF
jgi:hypothetical protein